MVASSGRSPLLRNVTAGGCELQVHKVPPSAEASDTCGHCPHCPGGGAALPSALDLLRQLPAVVLDQAAAQKPWTSPLHLHLTSPSPPRSPALPPPLLVCATFHPLILLLFLSSSIPRSSRAPLGVCLISLPVHPIARSARPALAPRRGGARPRRPARPPRPARRRARRGEAHMHTHVVLVCAWWREKRFTHIHYICIHIALELQGCMF